MILSLLIPVLLPRDQSNFSNLYAELVKQIGDNYIEILYDDDTGQKSIGAKRNDLLKRAWGEYVAFIDADDWIVPDYIELLLAGIATNPDCCSLRGIITWDGINPELFEHSIKYDKYETIEGAKPDEVKYLRYPNHLNCIRADIAKQFKFPETNHGEDTDWATQIFKSGLLKTEYYIEQVLYYYQFKPVK